MGGASEDAGWEVTPTFSYRGTGHVLCMYCVYVYCTIFIDYVAHVIATNVRRLYMYMYIVYIIVTMYRVCLVLLSR